uniref:uncharacterized protein n=1 Tax=Centroberyx gerrardi TaxID=166262 RepID=UPI003AAC3732
MVSVKTLLSLAALLLVSVVPMVTEVVRSMSECAEFLLKETPPRIPGVLEGGNIRDQRRYKPICQTFDNTRRFVTLYDTDNKIPVFSAYKFTGSIGRRPDTLWKIEPQLENEKANKNMRRVDKKRVYNHQAGDIDYRNSSFDRGHIFPSSHAFNTSDKHSTFTLTNIVPQVDTFNKKSWSRMESCVKCVLEIYCINQNNNPEGFVVTGATPSAGNFLKNRVNIPSMLWSAFCCYSTKTNKWLASAHWGDNVPDEGDHKYLKTKTLAQLNERMSTAGSKFEVFPDTQCPLDSTVAEFYPEIIAEYPLCHCPPTASTKSAPPASTSAPPTSTSALPTATSVPSTTIGSTTAATTIPSTTTATTSSIPKTTAPLCDHHHYYSDNHIYCPNHKYDSVNCYSENQHFRHYFSNNHYANNSYYASNCYRSSNDHHCHSKLNYSFKYYCANHRYPSKNYC